MNPIDIGLPSHFTSFRPRQWEAVEYALDVFNQREWPNAFQELIEDTRAVYCGLGLPTGSGKTLTAMAIANTLGVKAVYLTATKGLQDQIAAEFDCPDVRGKINYTCARTPAFINYKWRCLTGADHNCLYYSSRSPSCPYQAAVSNGMKASLAVTNYAWWLSSRRMTPQPLGDVQLLICDEAGLIEDELERALETRFSSEDFDLLDSRQLDGTIDGLMSDPSGLAWQKWCNEQTVDLKRRLSGMDKQDDDYQDLKRRHDDLVRIASLNGAGGRSSWVWEWSPPRESHPYVSFLPIWPGNYSHVLFSDIPYVLLMSGTLRPFILRQLVKDSPFAFKEWSGVFPPQHGPVYHVPTVKLSWKSTDEDYKTLVARIDSILAARPNRRGIIHTASYDRAVKIQQLSSLGARMLLNKNGSGVRDTLQTHRESQDSVLVSPSFTTGYDFPDDLCRFQIIAKTPFPNTTSRVMKERCKNPAYRLSRTAQTLAQMCGRGRRSETDWCENIILDNSVAQFKSGEGKSYLPAHFQIYTVLEPPKPMRSNE